MHTLPSPFHPGELAVQDKLGVRDQVHQYAPRFVRSYLPSQHQELLGKLPFILVGSIDYEKQPTASILFGFPGFITTPSDIAINFSTQILEGDPLSANLHKGAPLGFLAIELETRRRNRMNGKVSKVNGEGFEVALGQSFGNCPQYIQARSFAYDEFDPQEVRKPTVRHQLEENELKMRVEEADTFFIASSYFEDGNDVRHGVDVSHRGGKPGFVKLDGETLLFPDFSGNNHFNTIGNIALNPKVGLLFPDFETGDLLFVHGEAGIIWDGPEVDAVEGAQRLITIRVTETILIEAAMPPAWRLHDYSPSLQTTGTFSDIQVDAKASEWRQLRLDRIERESDVINSFYLTPVDSGSLAGYKAGQHLPIRVPAKPKALRTYTISRAPSGDQYRLSVKREAGGEISRHLHDKLKVGDIIDAKAPAGQFHLSENFDKPVVFVSAGVGITPMIAMLEELVNTHGCTQGKRCPQPIVFIHAARNGDEHAFKNHPVLRAAEDHGVKVIYAYSQPKPIDLVDKSFHIRGRLKLEHLLGLLPNKNSDVYLCGPFGFMQGMRQHFIDLGVPENQISQELFGPAETTAEATPDVNVPVNLKAAGQSFSWNPSKGTLLDHIEKAGVEAPFSCRSGSCGTCITKILRGKVKHPDSTLFETQDGEALICCALPAPDQPDEELVLDL